MNIFDVLNQGKSRLHEPSVSAMLGYLMCSHKDHGLGDSFLRSFLCQVQENISAPFLGAILERSFINADVSLEQPYSLDGARKDIDIEVSVLNENKKEDCRIIIENKIKKGAAQIKQLDSYYKAVLQDEKDIRNLMVIFLTPKTESKIFQHEFSNLEINYGHYKFWMYWNDQNSGVVKMIQDILQRELIGEINPINEYMKQTLKAFILHIRSFADPDAPIRYRINEDIGSIIKDIEVHLGGDKTYRIVLRDSSQIQVYYEGEKVVAKPILRKIIRERKLTVPVSGLNTRQMGAQIVNALTAQISEK